MSLDLVVFTCFQYLTFMPIWCTNNLDNCYGFMIEIHNVSIIVAIVCLPWNEVVVLEVQGK